MRKRNLFVFQFPYFFDTVEEIKEYTINSLEKDNVLNRLKSGEIIIIAFFIEVQELQLKENIYEVKKILEEQIFKIKKCNGRIITISEQVENYFNSVDIFYKDNPYLEPSKEGLNSLKEQIGLNYKQIRYWS